MNFHTFEDALFMTYIVTYHDMNRATLIERIEEARLILEKLLTLLRSAPVERDRFLPTSISPEESIGEHAKLPESRARKSSGTSSQASGSPKAWDSKGEFRQWQDLLRIGD